jgi:hypothetical protein
MFGLSKKEKELQKEKEKWLSYIECVNNKDTIHPNDFKHFSEILDLLNIQLNMSKGPDCITDIFIELKPHYNSLFTILCDKASDNSINLKKIMRYINSLVYTAFEWNSNWRYISKLDSARHFSRVLPNTYNLSLFLEYYCILTNTSDAFKYFRICLDDGVKNIIRNVLSQKNIGLEEKIPNVLMYIENSYVTDSSKKNTYNYILSLEYKLNSFFTPEIYSDTTFEYICENYNTLLALKTELFKHKIGQWS